MTDPSERGQEIVDMALDSLMSEFHDLSLQKQKEDRAAHRWHRETRWTRLVRYLKEHPGEEVALQGIHSNSVQRLKKRFPGLVVQGYNHRFLPLTPEAEAAGHKRGKKVCDMTLRWPAAKKA